MDDLAGSYAYLLTCIVPHASSAEDASIPDSLASKSPGCKDITTQENVTHSPPPGPETQPVPLPTSAESSGLIAESGETAPPSSEYESEGSAMDESSDSSSAGSSSADQEMLGEESTPEPTNIEESEMNKPTDQEGTVCLSSESASHPLPERPRFAGTESHADLLGDPTSQEQEESEVQDLPESSDASEAYEPPEPEPNPSAHYSPFSPAPSQANLGDTGRQARPDESQTGRPLTESRQGLDSESRAFLQLGPLDVRRIVARGNDSRLY